MLRAVNKTPSTQSQNLKSVQTVDHKTILSWFNIFSALMLRILYTNIPEKTGEP